MKYTKKENVAPDIYLVLPVLGDLGVMYNLSGLDGLGGLRLRDMSDLMWCWWWVI